MGKSINPMCCCFSAQGEAIAGSAPGPIVLDEFAASYSLAGCSPALPASASPAGFYLPHALEASGNYPGSIDLLLSDVDMPRMDGLELCQNIVAERPGIKVLLMSGDLWARERARMKGLPFLQKPFTATALRDSIEALLGPIPPCIDRGPC